MERQDLYRLRELEEEIAQLKKQLQAQKDFEVPHEILNVNEAMKFLDMPRHILYSRVNAGQIPAIRIGKLYKFKKALLEEYREAKQKTKVNVEDFVDRYMQKNVLKA